MKTLEFIGKKPGVGMRTPSMVKNMYDADNLSISLYTQPLHSQLLNRGGYKEIIGGYIEDK